MYNNQPKNKKTSPTLNSAQKEPQGSKKREPLRKVAIKKENLDVAEEKENINPK